MTSKEFEEIIFKNADKDYGIYPPPTNPQLGLNILIEHFLGEDWYTADPVGVEQVNTIAISEILFRYPKKKNLFFRIFSKIKGIYKIHKF